MYWADRSTQYDLIRHKPCVGYLAEPAISLQVPQHIPRIWTNEDAALRDANVVAAPFGAIDAASHMQVIDGVLHIFRRAH